MIDKIKLKVLDNTQFGVISAARIYFRVLNSIRATIKTTLRDEFND